MEAVDSLRKLKEKINKKKRKEEKTEVGNSLSAETVRAKKKNKKRSDDITNKVDAKQMKRRKQMEETTGVREITKKRRTKELNQNSRQKGRKSIEYVKRADAINEAEDAFERQNDEEMALTTKLESKDHDTNSIGLDEADTRSFKSSGKPKKSAKQKKERKVLGKDSSQDDLLKKKGNVADDEVDQMSSGDEDNSKGMKKWVMQYHQTRPGIKVLQERIDDFITAHEAQEEQARKEREAQAAEGGWTVVVHHKGRKKTTEAESGIAVGSVAQAAVLDKMAKKKSKDVGLDFYRFQRREAHRNEIMMLQSKFEQDKKRIQEMRAARKFRPY
ncbi:uncharacterized protein [Primulina huaijiensis]|uniref:uncharacterized protein isoform X2 n=1 Tax=Primulina huaijiensis TaxID=1492673 RepID=UPI003CC7781A